MSPSITTTLTVDSFHQNKLNDQTSFSSSTMKNDSKTTPSQLQFFVRLMWTCNSLVIRASREDTVKSLLKSISYKTKIPIEYQRLIYRGKQLHSEQSLAECCIENDTCLQLIGHLRSMGFPMGCEAVDDTVSLILRLCKGESVKDASRILHCRMMKFMQHKEYVSVFMFMKVPLLMVTLYNSPYANNKGIADFCIRQLMIFCDHIESAQLQVIYFEVVLEFCELLRGVGFESNDLLYVVCRGSFGRLLENVGGVSDRDTKRRILFQGCFDCVVEISDKLLGFLDLSLNSPTSQALLYRDIHDFEKFSAPLRIGIAEHQAVFDVPVDCGFLCEEDSLIARVVDRFRLVFIQLLSKMDECLQGMECCLVNKEQGEGGGSVIYYGWYYYLSILKELYHISKLYTGAEDKFWGVLLRRKSMLCHLIVKYAENTDDHRWVLKNRSVTDFESRRHLVMMLFFHELKDELWDFHEMLIDRSQLLAESFVYISQAKPKSLQRGLFMEFKNEDATGPGVLREWFVLVCQEIFSPQNALFMACPNDRRRFFPNAASKIHPLHLEYFSFCGRIIALALRSKVHVGIVFDRVFHGQLAGKYITLEDIRDADPIMYSSCKQILNMDADSIDSDTLGLTFATEVWELGRREVIELCLGGESCVVDSKNREEYVRLLIHNRFVTSISKQVSYFAKGFADILSGSSQEFFQSLELEELDWMLHGSENAISVEDWKAHTVYNGYKDIDRQISWFWEIVARMSVEQRKVLLFFWTSVKHLPVEGFRGLDTRLHICRTSELDSHLPSSHTCFYELCFPPYSSLAIMQDRLRVITQEHISCSFGTP